MTDLPIKWVSIYNIDSAIDMAINKLEMVRPTYPSEILAFEKQIIQVARHMMRAIVDFITKSHSIPSQLDVPKGILSFSSIMYCEDLNDRLKNPYDPKITEACSKILYNAKYAFIQDIVDKYTLFNLQDTPVTFLHHGKDLVVLYHLLEKNETEI